MTRSSDDKKDAKGLKALLLAMPDVGDDGDFVRHRDFAGILRGSPHDSETVDEVVYGRERP